MDIKEIDKNIADIQDEIDSDNFADWEIEDIVAIMNECKKCYVILCEHFKIEPDLYFEATGECCVYSFNYDYIVLTIYEDNDKNHFNEDAELVRHLCHEFVHALQNHGDGPMPDQTKHWLKDPAEIDARKREIELAEIVGY